MPNELTTTGGMLAPVVTPAQVDLITRTVASGATPDELKLYLYDCERQGVHPLDKLIHFTKRGGKYVPIIGIDFMRQQAAATGECVGISDAEFTGEPRKEGFAARVVVKRLVGGVIAEFVSTARWEEYFPGPQAGQMWLKMPHVMLGKVSEALALRKGFPRQLAGLYAKEEMDQADEPRPNRQAQAPRERETPAPAPVSPVRLDPALEATVMPDEPPAAQDGPVGQAPHRSWQQWIATCTDIAIASGAGLPSVKSERDAFFRKIAEAGGLACHAEPWPRWGQYELARLCELCGDPFVGE